MEDLISMKILTQYMHDGLTNFYSADGSAEVWSFYMARYEDMYDAEGRDPWQPVVWYSYRKIKGKFKEKRHLDFEKAMRAAFS